MNFSLASIAFASLAANNVHAAVWNVINDAQLPKPVSDHSSTFVPADVDAGISAGIYIAGGCDAPEGNTHVDASGLMLDFFMCESISDELHVFDATTMTFQTSTAKLPRARYRHAAVEAKGKLWLIGGRTLYDDIINEVDVYDPATDSWTTVGTIPSSFSTSDNGAFANADGSTIYVVGGYNQNYFAPDALATTFSFESQAALDQQAINVALGNAVVSEDLVVTIQADLLQGRGDIHAVTSQDGTKAYVAGGYAGMCQPLTSAEVYDFATDEWSSAGDLLKARGDGAMVEASGTIFVIGGEVNHPDQCAAPELVPPLSVQSVAVDDVEALEYESSQPGAELNVWSDVADIPEFRFRFSAASWPDTGVAYAFGGQTSFDEACSCFPTTAEITTIDSGILLGGNVGNGGGSAPCEDDDCDEPITNNQPKEVVNFNDDKAGSEASSTNEDESSDSYDMSGLSAAPGFGFTTTALVMTIVVAVVW